MNVAELCSILVNKNRCSFIHKAFLCQTALGHKVLEQRKSQYSTCSSSKRLASDGTTVEPTVRKSCTESKILGYEDHAKEFKAHLSP